MIFLKIEAINVIERVQKYLLILHYIYFIYLLYITCNNNDSFKLNAYDYFH